VDNSESLTTARLNPGPPDWSIGRYEDTATDLLPAARRLVEVAGIARGERVVDVGCGTGSAALAAAARGATVVGVDPAARLLAVAREQARAVRVSADFVVGTAAALPIDDATADVVLSAFGVIFAPDPRAAAAEFARALAPGGRIVLSAWLPGGPVVEVNRLAAVAVRGALGVPSGPVPFPWHDESSIAELFESHGLAVSVRREELTINAASAEAYLTSQFRSHPLAVSGLAVLERHGGDVALRGQLMDVLDRANESSTSFRTTNSYLIATIR
jgi:SAM-dependent methyltransferase